jgi:hypothetical protein
MSDDIYLVNFFTNMTPLVKRYHASLPFSYESRFDAARVRLPYGVFLTFFLFPWVEGSCSYPLHASSASSRGSRTILGGSGDFCKVVKGDEEREQIFATQIGACGE